MNPKLDFIVRKSFPSIMNMNPSIIWPDGHSALIQRYQCNDRFIAYVSQS